MDVMTPAEANPQNVQDLTLFVSRLLYLPLVLVLASPSPRVSLRVRLRVRLITQKSN